MEMANGSVHEQCWDGTTELENIKRCIREGHSVLILMRGVPGSGKSHLARELLTGTNGVIHSTDDYFIQNGVYNFDANKLQDFHQKNFRETKNSMSHGIKLIIVDNTNIYSIHMKPYVKQAVKYMYEVYFVEPQTDWKSNSWECARKNTHLIAVDKISYLLETFETVTLEQMIRPTRLKLKPPLEAASDEHLFVVNNFEKFYAGINWSDAMTSCDGEQAFSEVHLKDLSVLPIDDDQKGQIGLCGSTGKANVEKEQSDDITKSNDENGISSEGQKQINAKPLLSLLPFKQPSHMPQITIGVQTSDVIRLVYMSGDVPDEIESKLTTKPQLIIVKKVKMEQDVIRKERSTQTSSNFIPSELDLLLALFPEEAPADLAHVLETAGIEMALRIFREIGAKMNIFAQPDEEETPDEGIRLSETFECEKVEPTAHELDGTVLATSPLGASGEANNMMTQKPIKSGYYRMELSIDMIRKLSQLFGDGEMDDGNTIYVDLPLWQWRQIYQAWQGLPVTGRHGEKIVYDDFDDEFPDILKTANEDEECINEGRLDILQIRQVVKVKKAVGRRRMDTAARLQLNHLYEKFADVDRNRIDECFKDNNYSTEATEATLTLFIEDENTLSQRVNISPKPCNCDNADSKIGGGAPRSKSADGITIDQVELANVQEQATTLREEIRHCLEKKKECIAKANDVKDPRVKQFYINEAQSFDRRAREYSTKANKRLADANTAKNFVDLHFMDVQSALKLLRNKLTALDRPENLRNGRSGRKLVVVTGYGKSSSGFSRVKPAVLQWLKQCGYEYHQPTNQGEIVVEAK